MIHVPQADLESLKGLSPLGSAPVQLTVSTNAIGLASPSARAVYALIGLDATNGIRVLDNADPTATAGILVAGGTTFALSGQSINRARFIRSGGADAVLNVQYYQP